MLVSLVNNKTFTVFDLIKEAENKLKGVGIETFELDAKILLAHSLGQHEKLVFKLNSRVSQYSYDKFTLLVKRRLKLEPIAYIVGYKHFWKQVYKVDKNVLIPRPETELIIEVILGKLQNRKNEKLHILDLGTGSGCIILSLLSELKNSFGVAVDVSDKALNIAKINANNLQLSKRLKFIKSNWFNALDEKESFDIIVSNPPYVAENEWQNLSKSIKNFEPSIALSDGGDGLGGYRVIAQSAKKFLKKGAMIILEIGYNQKNLVENTFENQGYKVGFYKDLQGIYRVASISCSVRH